MKIDKAIEELMVLKDNPDLDDVSAEAIQLGIDVLEEKLRRLDRSDKLIVELERKYPAEGSK